MISRSVFLDTVAFLALLNLRDSLHSQAMTVRDRLSADAAKIVTSDWVLSEFLGSTAAVESRQRAADWVKKLRRSSLTTIVEATRSDWLDAFGLFASRTDKAWSLVDCSSILICQKMGICEVFTRDHHFEQAGFTILLK